MQISSLFRVILISGLILEILSVIAGFSLSESTLPPLLLEYLAQQENEEVSSGLAILILMASLTLLVLLPISIVGAFMFKSWGRTLYVSVTIFVIFCYPIFGPVVMNPWEAMFSDISFVFMGLAMAMMFSGEIGNKFNSTTVQH